MFLSVYFCIFLSTYGKRERKRGKDINRHILHDTYMYTYIVIIFPNIRKREKVIN